MPKLEIYYIKSDDNTYKVIEVKGAKITETRLLNNFKVEFMQIHKITLELYLKNSTYKLVSRKEIQDFINNNRVSYRLPEIQLSFDLQTKLF